MLAQGLEVDPELVATISYHWPQFFGALQHRPRSIPGTQIVGNCRLSPKSRVPVIDDGNACIGFNSLSREERVISCKQVRGQFLGEHVDRLDGLLNQNVVAGPD